MGRTTFVGWTRGGGGAGPRQPQPQLHTHLTLRVKLILDPPHTPPADPNPRGLPGTEWRSLHADPPPPSAPGAFTAPGAFSVANTEAHRRSPAHRDVLRVASTTADVALAEGATSPVSLQQHSMWQTDPSVVLQLSAVAHAHPQPVPVHAVALRVGTAESDEG
jgi:hypothetical protein